MREIAQFLMDNYYAKAPEYVPIPTMDELELGLTNHPDKIMVRRDDEGNITGVAMFLRLEDDTYNALGCLDVSNTDALIELLKERGDNICFMVVCGEGFGNIRRGIREVKEKYKPKSISWWNPDMTYLHKYNLN